MTDEKTGPPSEDRGVIHDQVGPEGEITQFPEPLPITLLDRVIAFVVLILPFSYLIDWIQEITQGKISQSINNIIVLIGIVLFLVVVGWLSKWIYFWRQRLLSKD